jgi:phosphoribosylformylglycinamidine (FGAM) synthase-like amidotransferase family enzyme
VLRDKVVLDKLKENGQLVFRYVDEKGKPAGYPYITQTDQ